MARAVVYHASHGHEHFTRPSTSVHNITRYLHIKTDKLRLLIRAELYAETSDMQYLSSKLRWLQAPLDLVLNRCHAAVSPAEIPGRYRALRATLIVPLPLLKGWKLPAVSKVQRTATSQVVEPLSGDWALG